MKKYLRLLKYKINTSPLLSKLIRWSKVYSPPGFGGVPVYSVLKFIIDEANKDNITNRANSVAYSIFLAIFPAIIFLFTLLPLMPFVQDYTQMFSDYLYGMIPLDAHTYLMGVITDITSRKREGLLSLGVFLALLFSSNGMLTLMSGFDKSYHITFRTRSYFWKRLVALNLTLVLTFLLIVSFFIIILGDNLFYWLYKTFELPETTMVVLKFIQWFVAVALVYTGVSIIYRYGPSMYKKFKFINIGSIIATTLFLISSIAFSYFINNFGRYNEIYGSIGALIVILIWLQINAFIILVGFELNASVAVHKDLMKSGLIQDDD
ncbi:MAG: YihY/virulence factor BrkB family protein [Saprospiraceae bacterium]|nr:YihY/virulence factor BrkB family protein [Saprospiraceae bacterium]